MANTASKKLTAEEKAARKAEREAERQTERIDAAMWALKDLLDKFDSDEKLRTKYAAVSDELSTAAMVEKREDWHGNFDAALVKLSAMGEAGAKMHAKVARIKRMWR